MIKRLSKQTDQIDLILCKDEIFASNINQVIYYTEGHRDVIIKPDFEVQKNVIVVALSTQDLKQLESGILMRDVEYWVNDEKYPDSKRNLVLTNNMNVWIC